MPEPPGMAETRSYLISANLQISFLIEAGRAWSQFVTTHFFFFFVTLVHPAVDSPKLTLPFISLFLPLAWLSDLTSWHCFCTCFLTTSPQLSAVLLFHLAWYCWTRYNSEDFCHIRELSRKQGEVIEENETKDRDVLRKGSFIIDERECESGWGTAMAALDQMDGI